MKERKKKKLGVWLSAAAVLIVLLGQAAVYAVGAVLARTGGLSGPALLVVFLPLEGVLIGLGIALLGMARERIHEINGGEEDDLSKY